LAINHSASVSQHRQKRLWMAKGSNKNSCYPGVTRNDTSQRWILCINKNPVGNMTKLYQPNDLNWCVTIRWRQWNADKLLWSKPQNNTTVHFYFRVLATYHLEIKLTFLTPMLNNSPNFRKIHICHILRQPVDKYWKKKHRRHQTTSEKPSNVNHNFTLKPTGRKTTKQTAVHMTGMITIHTLALCSIGIVFRITPS